MRADTPSLLTYPMHGQHKLSGEGYRTRDGHFIEWFGRKLDGRGVVVVQSRPEPAPLASIHALRRARVAANTWPAPNRSWRLPEVRDRRRWWVHSAPSYRWTSGTDTTPAVLWNPFVAVSPIANRLFGGSRRTVLDLLDDWSVHYAFASLSREVEDAYARAFDAVSGVTANSEGTLSLAHRFGRSDAVLMPNGVDPERFSTQSTAVGPLTVGYVGKIGKRVDLELVIEAAQALPAANFVFAGPILDREYRAPMEALSNLTLLGDVHYANVPALLATFDVGWVPHRVGAGEVGGDVIKTYEYRAAGLPVLTTPVLGAGVRGLTSVYPEAAADHVAWLRTRLEDGPRAPREPGTIPASLTWSSKADAILRLLELKH